MTPADSSAQTPPPHNRPGLYLTNWQKITAVLLTIGYAGYYICRVHLSICTPALIADKALQLDKSAIGKFITIGTGFYAAGKFLIGSSADFLGGRRMFLAGMIGAILCTVVFGMSAAVPMFTLAWALNRGIQSGGWAALVKISSRWFSYSIYGTIMGVISLSYLFGDFLSRILLGRILSWLDDHSVAHAWRIVFFCSAAVLGTILLLCLFFLKDSPASVGEPEPHTNPENVYGGQGDTAGKLGAGRLLRPLLTSPVFWVVCALSFGFTIVRDTFNNWIPTYLTEVTKMKEGEAGTWSSLFPLFGGFSVLIAGFLSDKMGHTGRAKVILGGLILSTPALMALAYIDFGTSPVMPIVVFCAVAFLMLGPYSFLAGAIGMDFGGKQGSATASGWIDGVGYVGGMLAGSWIGNIAERGGWPQAFQTLAAISALTTVAAAIYLWQKSRMSAVAVAG